MELKNNSCIPLLLWAIKKAAGLKLPPGAYALREREGPQERTEKEVYIYINRKKVKEGKTIDVQLLERRKVY